MYPNATDYNRAIPYLENRTENLQTLVPLEKSGLSGNFAVVFKTEDSSTKKRYALKCFTVESAERERRYKEISNYLSSLNSSYFCTYDYFQDEFAITISNSEKLYPVLKMEWIEGRTLGKFLKEEKSNTALLGTLFENWIKLSRFLQNRGIAHGDLKHDNMIISDSGEITLIDYDGIFVSSLLGKKALEVGSPNYQHPKRGSNFDLRIDYFPQLVIAISIKVISLKPHLLEKYSNGENLLFVKRDFEDLENSKLFQELENIGDEVLQHLLEELEKAISDFNYNPNIFLNSQPTYLIFNIDKSDTTIYSRMKDIVNQRVLNFSKAKNIFYSIVEFNSNSKSSNPKLRTSDSSEIFSTAEQSPNFQNSLEKIRSRTSFFLEDFPEGNRPILINLLSSRVSFENLDLETYNIYTSDISYKTISKFPQIGDLGDEFYNEIVQFSSFINVKTRNYFQKKWNEPISKNSAGVLINSNDVITLKFLDSILFVKLTK